MQEVAPQAFFFSGLDKSLVAGEINAAGLLAATLRLFTLSSRHRGSFDEACPTLEAGASGLWRAALVSCTFSLSTSLRRSFDEASHVESRYKQPLVCRLVL